MSPCFRPETQISGMATMEKQSSGGGKKVVLWSIVVVAVIAAGGAGYFFVYPLLFPAPVAYHAPCCSNASFHTVILTRVICRVSGGYYRFSLG